MRSLLHAIPTDVEQLTQYLRYLLRSRPPLPFSRIIDFHNRHSQHQSVHSHNILLGLSIRHGLPKTSQSLLNSLSMNHIEPNEETEKLVVRYLTSRGFWDKAWQQVINRYSTIQAIPTPIILELLAPNFPNLPRLRPSPAEKFEKHNAPYPVCHIPQKFSKLILHRFVNLPPDALGQISLRVLNYVVRSLLKEGHGLAAIHLTESYIKTLPKRISTKRIERVQALVNTHLSTGEIKLSTFKRRKRLIEKLYGMHPQLAPNSKTLFLLMRYMAHSKRCGITAYLLYKSYLQKWGQTMDTLEVRGRIIKYAIKQRKLGIAREMSSLFDTSTPQSSPSPSEDSIVTKSSKLPSWRTIYPKKGQKYNDFKRMFYKRLRVGRQNQRELRKIKAARRNTLQKSRPRSSLPTQLIGSIHQDHHCIS